jgi:FkbM family methyltransferase
MTQQLPFQPYIIHVQAEGEEFEFYVANEVGKEWYDLGRPDPRAEMRFIRNQMVKAGNLVIECGCHHGFTTILLSRWVGSQGKIVAFDANPHNANIALKNMELNAITNVKIYSSAIGNQTGTLWITNASNARVTSAVLHGEVEVTATRLDDFLGGQTPDLIKIDVEGYELEVLKGLRLILDKKESNLAIEVHCDELRNYGATPNELFEFIGLEDYMCWLGIGEQANESIQPFIVNMTQIPPLSRVYLFAIPKYKGYAKMSG